MKAELKRMDIDDLSKMDELALLGMIEGIKKAVAYSFCDEAIIKLKKEIKIEERKRKLDRLI